MASSGVYSYNPSLTNMGIDAFGRLGIRPASFDADHMLSLRSSLNSVQSIWANLGVNLWSVDLLSVPLIQGVATYDVPENTVMMLETYVRNYDLNSPVDVAPSFQTVSASRTVTVNLANHGFQVGFWTQIIVPVSVGGIILLGYYQVVSVPSINSYTILHATAATATELGGIVPLFSTVASSATVTVVLPDNGLLPGQTFNVQVQALIGGLDLLGAYTVATVVDADTFTITAPYVAGSTESGYENGGETQIAGQSANSQPTDRLISAFSRTDYASLANKFSQGASTSYYFDRTIAPTVTIWPVPDGNGPYELRYYRMRQLQDANPQGGETADIPYRFVEALVSALAAHLSMTWKPEMTDKLMAYAEKMWGIATFEDRQRVRLAITPDFAGYYR